MEVSIVQAQERIWFPDQIALDTCVFCGNEFGKINFKGKCVCEDCLSFVKELM